MRVFCLLFLGLSFHVINAQNLFGFHVGPTWGMNRTNIGGTAESSPLFGLSLAGFFQGNIDYGLFIRTGLELNKKGIQYRDVQWLDETGFEVGRVNLRIDQQYVGIPLKLGYQFGERIGFRLMGGVYAGYLLRNTYGFDGTLYSGESLNISADRKSDYRAFDLGWTTGLEGFFRISKDLRFDLGISYQQGTVDMRNSMEQPDLNDRTQAIFAMLGVSFPLR
ncbi:MAG: PorT family protein [Bacteroidota bacterium]|nr:PorT family protein [Bacteroidota bacterium]